MSSLTAISSAPPQLSQGKLAQARQAADQAEAYAHDLRTQANEAQREAQRTRGKADDLTAQQTQSQSQLKSRNIVLHGPSRPQVIVKYIFSRLGVPESRIEMSDTTGLPSCTDDCDAADMRVEIGLAGTAAKEATIASLPSGM